MKLDFRQAFFNINIHPKSRFVTTFVHNNNYYAFKRLPFGISVAPYVCQRFLSAIVKFVRLHTPFVWGHIDDLLIAHHDPVRLQVILDVLLCKVAQAGWVVNDKKSVFHPVKRIKFLGAIWGQRTVKRDPSVSATLLLLWAHVRNRLLTGKVLQRVRGYFGYYLSFAGSFFSVFNRILLIRDKRRYDGIFHFLLLRDSIDLLDNHPKRLVHIATDATLCQIAAVSLADPSLFLITRSRSSSIIANEIKGALLGVALFRRFYDTSLFRLILHVDNMAAVSFFNTGRSNYASLSIRDHFALLYSLHKQVHNLCMHTVYISTSANPADALSRKSLSP